jgi:hypothetical protein
MVAIKVFASLCFLWLIPVNGLIAKETPGNSYTNLQIFQDFPNPNVIAFDYSNHPTYC